MAERGQQKARLSSHNCPSCRRTKGRVKDDERRKQESSNRAEVSKRRDRSSETGPDERRRGTERSNRKVIKANREVDQLQRRNIKLEAQSRRNNTKFFNVRENEAESSFSDTEKDLRKLLVDNAERRGGGCGV